MTKNIVIVLVGLEMSNLVPHCQLVLSAYQAAKRILIKTGSYRPIAAFILAVLVFQVFLLQSFHQYVGHHHESEHCSIEGVHMHDAADDHHHSCDLCIILFSPTLVEQNSIETLHTPTHLSDYEFIENDDPKSQKYRQSYLRGPPVQMV